jgi:D-alanyl-D-alanine dipeptidase
VVRRAGLVLIAMASVAHADDKPGDLVEVQTVIPDAVLDLRYATTDNVTGAVMYPKAVCKLRRAVLARLAAAATTLRAQDRRILLWDCYRPTSIQKLLWKAVPDARYVANPKVGSNHSRGAAVDLGVVDKDGNPVVLPTEFDDLSAAAAPSRALRGKKGAEARALAAAMKKAGFTAISTEWWHFDASDRAKYPLSDEPL